MEPLLWVTNIGRAAAISLKYPVMEVRTKFNAALNIPEVQFGFARTANIRIALDCYDDSKYEVDARSYFKALGDLKSQRWNLMHPDVGQQENLANLKN